MNLLLHRSHTNQRTSRARRVVLVTVAAFLVAGCAVYRPVFTPPERPHLGALPPLTPTASIPNLVPVRWENRRYFDHAIPAALLADAVSTITSRDTDAGDEDCGEIELVVTKAEPSRNVAWIIFPFLTLMVAAFAGVPAYSSTFVVETELVVRDYYGSELFRTGARGKGTAYAAFYWGTIDPNMPFGRALNDALTRDLEAAIHAGPSIMNGLIRSGYLLHNAIAHRDAVRLERLLDAGSPTEAPDKLGRRPLHNAAKFGADDMIRILLLRGARIDGTDGEGATPLMLAALARELGTVRLLLDSSAGVEARDEMGATPLMYAVDGGSVEVTRELVSRGAQVKARQSRGETAIFVAATRGHLEVVEALLDWGANPNERSDDGWTPLCASISAGHADVTRLLIARGAVDSVEATHRVANTCIRESDVDGVGTGPVITNGFVNIVTGSQVDGASAGRVEVALEERTLTIGETGLKEAEGALGQPCVPRRRVSAGNDLFSRSWVGVMYKSNGRALSFDSFYRGGPPRRSLTLHFSYRDSTLQGFIEN